jgi:hypothetical protein
MGLRCSKQVDPVGVLENYNKRKKMMSDHNNESLLENLFEEALAMGMTDQEAEAYANQRFEQLGDMT